MAHAGLHTLKNSEGKAQYNLKFSDQMVDMFNSYSKDYKMKIFFFFGHNHSKGDAEFYKTATAGSSIISTYLYDGTVAYNREIGLNFTYGHMGYLNTSIGVASEQATVMHVGSGGITLQRVQGTTYSGGAFVAITDCTKDVPVVKALDKRYDPGATLTAEVEGEGEYKYQWYKANGVDFTADGFVTEEIANATDKSYKPVEKDVYYFCKVSREGSNAASEFATTTVTFVGEAEAEPETIKPGTYLIVLKDNEKHFAIMSDENGVLSLEEVQIRDNKVVGPKSDFYLWDIQAASDGNFSVFNMGSEYYLSRAGRGQTGLVTTQSTSDSYINAWNYDTALHILYNISTGGGSTKYYYPIISEGKLSIGNVTTLTEANIYLMEVGAGDVPAPNTDPNAPNRDKASEGSKIPNTADNGMAGIWAALALTASAAMTGAVVRKKKTEA